MTKINAALTDAFLNSALGDAWGYLHEFSSYQEIIAQNSELPKRLKISDDTQMAIATFEATIDLLSQASTPAGEDAQIIRYWKYAYPSPRSSSSVECYHSRTARCKTVPWVSLDGFAALRQLIGDFNKLSWR